MTDILRSAGKLGLTLNTLATHRGRIKDRLLAAAPEMAGVNCAALSGDAQPWWDEVGAGMTGG
ncbi:MAG: hypothetical protein ABI211_00425, partial [Vicinamibacterales bacterium]